MSPDYCVTYVPGRSILNPESLIPNPEPRAASRELRIASRELRIASPDSPPDNESKRSDGGECEQEEVEDSLRDRVDDPASGKQAGEDDG